jgi:hypothetical protein
MGWSGTSFNLPVQVASNRSDVAKCQFFYQTVNAIQTTNMSYQNCLGALTSHFKTGESILKECKGHLVLMYEEDSRSPQWTNQCFSYAAPHLLMADGRPIALPAGTAVGAILDLSYLPNVAYIYFQIIVDPAQVHGKCKVPIKTFKAAVEVPPAIQRNSVVKPVHDLDELLHVKDVLKAILAVMGLPPSTGMCRGNRQLYRLSSLLDLTAEGDACNTNSCSGGCCRIFNFLELFGMR